MIEILMLDNGIELRDFGSFGLRQLKPCKA
jgi:hypothetical protein